MTKRVILHNLSHPLAEPIQVIYCNTFLCRLRGLTFRRKLSKGDGLLLDFERDSRINSAIHMLGVRLDLAAIWMNSQLEVVDVQLARRWRLAYVPKQPARYVLELSPDHINDFYVGDQITIENEQSS